MCPGFYGIVTLIHLSTIMGYSASLSLIPKSGYAYYLLIPPFLIIFTQLAAILAFLQALIYPDFVSRQFPQYPSEYGKRSMFFELVVIDVMVILGVGEIDVKALGSPYWYDWSSRNHGSHQRRQDYISLCAVKVSMMICYCLSLMWS